MFVTKYPNNFILEREMELPEMKFQGKVIPTAYKRISQDFKNEVFWTNDEEDSLYKIAYNKPLNCNWMPDPHYHAYNCMIDTKLVYLYPEIPEGAVDFSLQTPKYTPDPYTYEHRVHMFGRQMNLFNMCISSRLFRMLEEKVIQWAFRRTANPVRLGRNKTTQLITIPIWHDEISEVKLQMSVRPMYLYWVLETLLRNTSALYDMGMHQFKFMYLIGDNTLRGLSEVYPDLVDGEDVITYQYNGEEYKRELLTAPNIVFYLKAHGNVKRVVDTLCGLFPDKFELSSGVPRFNCRLNNNVYISFGGHNEGKFNMEDLYIPDEYRSILESRDPSRRHLSERFSGHTIMNEDGSANNIQSYKKLIKSGSFLAVYKQYGLEDYYNDTFAVPVPVPPPAPEPVPTMSSSLARLQRIRAQAQLRTQNAGTRRKRRKSRKKNRAY
jgi:hypothetical protein